MSKGPHMLFRALFLSLLTALPAAAEAICDPPRGTRLTVTGVAANDTLNMRREPSASARVVAQIGPNERGVTATGRSAWSRGQCTTTCSGAEGGLNDRGRAIAFGCKAEGNIWYEVRRSNGTTGWSSARFLDIAGGGTPAPSPPPVIESRASFNCLSSGRLTVEIQRGGSRADVTIGGRSYELQQRGNPGLRYSFESRQGARLLGAREFVEWRWPNGDRDVCIAR
jgi:hypothetical protein